MKKGHKWWEKEFPAQNVYKFHQRLWDSVKNKSIAGQNTNEEKETHHVSLYMSNDLFFTHYNAFRNVFYMNLLKSNTLVDYDIGIITLGFYLSDLFIVGSRVWNR